MLCVSLTNKFPGHPRGFDTIIFTQSSDNPGGGTRQKVNIMRAQEVARKVLLYIPAPGWPFYA